MWLESEATRRSGTSNRSPESCTRPFPRETYGSTSNNRSSNGSVISLTAHHRSFRIPDGLRAPNDRSNSTGACFLPTLSPSFSFSPPGGEKMEGSIALFTEVRNLNDHQIILFPIKGRTTGSKCCYYPLPAAGIHRLFSLEGENPKRGCPR